VNAFAGSPASWQARLKERLKGCLQSLAKATARRAQKAEGQGVPVEADPIARAVDGFSPVWLTKD
jgi:hypothetical protein